jgi:hypothetical protein
MKEIIYRDSINENENFKDVVVFVLSTFVVENKPCNGKNIIDILCQYINTNSNIFKVPVGSDLNESIEDNIVIKYQHILLCLNFIKFMINKYMNKNSRILILFPYSCQADWMVECMKDEEFKDTLFLISAGNDSHNLDKIPVYPQCSKLENGIVIGSIKKTGERQFFSNYGNMVDVYDIGEKTSESMARYCGKVIDYWNQNPDKNNIQIKNELLKIK